MFFQAGGIAVVLWALSKLAADCGVSDRERAGFDGVAIAHNVSSVAEVDAILAAAEQAGAVITRAAAQTFYGGYAGVFLDPDGHAWEVAHNPGFELREDGSLVVPDFGSARAGA